MKDFNFIVKKDLIYNIRVSFVNRVKVFLTEGRSMTTISLSLQRFFSSNVSKHSPLDRKIKIVDQMDGLDSFITQIPRHLLEKYKGETKHISKEEVSYLWT